MASVIATSKIVMAHAEPMEMQLIEVMHASEVATSKSVDAFCS
jgi:hypothetical protein